MTGTMRHWLAAALALAFVLSSPAASAQGDAGPLVSAQWLAKNLGNADILVLDASPPPLHAKQHIPGAVGVDVFTLASFGARDVPHTHPERIYRAAGISPGKKIVMYDQGGTWFATRLFFALHYHGFPAKDLAILDGGFAKWQAEGLPVAKDATPAPAPGTFRVAAVDEQARVRLPELLAASGDRAGNVLLDALQAEYHFGANAFFSKAGHIPHAVLLPAEDLFNPDKTFKSPAEMRRMLAYLSIRPEQEVHAHCGGGGAASVPYFALKFLLGYPKVRLSLESQMGWLQDDRDLPFWTYAAPALMRETDWLQAWGGRMLRMYGIARVSVVDVRAPAAFGQGHLPFALNVPAETFRSHRADPGKLAGILGAAGVNPADEAVVVSGGGLTPESALAFVLLEKLGQKKVSVFMDSLESPDSLDRMARKGFAMTKDLPAARPVAYPGEVKDARTLADAQQSRGAYAKVYIASGAAVPAKAPEGKVVHVPYTDLLDAEGRPKAAKDIWALLAKAGVPRYAELVTFSDDPGEAAANYFVLRLMGFPDVKLLASR